MGFSRSLLSGASIFHTYPLGQPCTVSFLTLEAPPTGFFADLYIIVNHKIAIVLYCLRHMQAARKYFNTYIHTYTLFKLEIQCSCRANIFEKKKLIGAVKI